MPMKRVLTMKKLVLVLLLFFSLCTVGCEDTDIFTATDAGIDAIRAVTLTDEQTKRIARGVSQQSDSQNTIASGNHPHARRLQRLTQNIGAVNGFDFDFKVYVSPTVNAFAMADGTIRVYSGLMDMLNDEELLFVIGHEMGHVTEKHIKKKMMLAYASSAVRKAIASQNNEAGDIARSALGALTEQLLNAQFSQQEERQADDFGVLLLKKHGKDHKPAVSALMKLATLGNNHSFLSSHPAPESRAKRLSKKAANPASPSTSSENNEESLSYVDLVLQWLQSLLSTVREFL